MRLRCPGDGRLVNREPLNLVPLETEDLPLAASRFQRALDDGSQVRAATFLDRPALSGRYGRVHTPTRALGTVVCTVPISRDGVFRAHFAGVGEPLVR